MSRFKKRRARQKITAADIHKLTPAQKMKLISAITAAMEKHKAEKANAQN